MKKVEELSCWVVTKRGNICHEFQRSDIGKEVAVIKGLHLCGYTKRPEFLVNIYKLNKSTE